MGLARPDAASGWGDSAKRSLSKRRKFVSPGAIRAGEILEILGFRGWENPAGDFQQGTGWAPATEALRFLARRPAEGEEIFSSREILF